MQLRVKAAIHSPDRLTRLSHFIIAKFLFSLPTTVRNSLFAGNQHYCPICRCKLRKFLVLHRPYHLWCPICRSLQRHRFIWLFINSGYINLGESPKRLLHIAPEPGLASYFMKIPRLDYISADLNDPKAMVKMDICDIQYPDNSFDVIFCSHVLEHVQDDKKALREFWRILKPTGQACILIPISAEITFEDLSIIDPHEREILFGQHDHVRRYGPDVLDRIKEADFKVTVIQTEDLADSQEINYMGLIPEEKIFLCQK